MEFIKATVRNYRVHKEQVIDFNSKLTLIGGENEKGKSTIAEAIYRALFLKADGQSELIETMRSSKHLGGDPEVELIFKTDGKIFTLLKKFGKKGSVTLSESSMPTLTGESAETMLTDIIKTKTNIQASSFKSNIKWPLLWVWQTKSGDDPVGLIGESKDRLMNKLQSLGAAAVLSSPLDLTISDKFSELNAKNYGNKGLLKVSSDLKLAQDALNEVTSSYNAAKEKVESLQDDSDRYESLKLDLQTELESNKAIKEDNQELSNRIAILSELDKKKMLQDTRYKKVKGEYDTLINTKNEISQIEARIGELSLKIEPSRKTLKDKKDRFDLNQITIKENSNELKIMHNNELLYRNTIDLCNIYKTILAGKKELAELLKVKKEADDYKVKIQELESELHKLLIVSKADVSNLNEIKRSLDLAKAKLDAISTSFEVISSDQDVFVDGIKQAIGNRVNYDEKFEIKVGNGTKILITPGKRDSLAQSKSQYEQLIQDFEQGIAVLGFKSLEDAQATLINRELLESKIQSTSTLLKGLNADKVDLKIGKLEGEISANQNALTQKAKGYKIQIESFNEDNVIDILKTNDALLEAQLDKLKLTNGLVDRLNSENDELEKFIQDLGDKIKDDEAELGEKNQNLKFIFQKEIDMQALQNKIMNVEKELQKEHIALSDIQDEIDKQIPGSVKSDEERLKRSLEISDGNVSKIKEELTKLGVRLTNNGTENPSENLNKLEAKLKIANDKYNAEFKKANAIHLLNKLFTEEQQQLANKLTEPLAKKINEYLLPLFGGTVKVSINQEAGEFKEFLISRDGKEAYSFNSLSGGTKEQFSAAIRLAMAEVLSVDFDNKLPVVFDDAFTNSDKGRIRRIQPMLDLATERGVQVIVLTCHPESYASLGAQKVMLN
jgi:DNA repair exonuclease SbcCD ATPase subunit